MTITNVDKDTTARTMCITSEYDAPVERDWTASEEEMQRASPFAGLSALKDKPKG